SPTENLNDSGAVVKSVITPACHAGGRGFESRPLRQINQEFREDDRPRILGPVAASQLRSKSVVSGGSDSMGTVFNRGTKDKPNWYVGYRENGKWKYRPSDQPTKALAKRFVQEIEGRIARGQVGIEEPASAPLCGALIEQFLEGLVNRNAK